MSTCSPFRKSENYIQADMDVSGDYMFVKLDSGKGKNINAGNFAEKVLVSDVDNAPNISMGIGTDIGSGSVCCRDSAYCHDSACCHESGSNNGMCSGPYIPEVDCGYNVYSNGVSINFLKDPFCFRNEFLFGKNSLNENIIHSNENIGENGSNMGSLQNKVHILKPLKKTKIVEVPVYIYKEKIVHKTEVVNKNVYVPTDKPIYVTKEVKVPVYKEQIKYVPTYIEKEKIYEIPKLEITDLIQQNLLYLHKHEIQYEKNSRVIERVIPRLNTRVVETTVQVPSIAHRNVNPNTAVVALTATNTEAKENSLGNILPSISETAKETSNQKTWEQLKLESNTFVTETFSSNVNEKPPVVAKSVEKSSVPEPGKENLSERQKDLLEEKLEEEVIKNVEEEEEDVENVEKRDANKTGQKAESKVEQKAEQNDSGEVVEIVEEKVEENDIGENEEKHAEKVEGKAEENDVENNNVEKNEEKVEEKVEEIQRLQDLPQFSSETYKNHKQINKKKSDVSTKNIDTKLKRLHTHVEAIQFNLNEDNIFVKENTKDDHISSNNDILITKYGESKNESNKSDI